MNVVSPMVGSSPAPKAKVLEPLLTDEELQSSLGQEIDDAIGYMSDTFSANWETAEEYYDGGCGLETVDGRSQAVATVVRNAIRGIRPSVMRLFTSTRQIVEYLAGSREDAMLAYQQSLYVNQLFWENDGYRVISDLFEDAALKRIAAVQWYWDENPVPCYAELTFLMEDEYQSLVDDDDVSIVSTTIHIEDLSSPEGQAQPVKFYDCNVSYIERRGRICIETIPLPAFFISKNATTAEDARVVGFQKSMRAGDVVRLGIDIDDLADLDDFDPEVSGPATAESEKRRKSPKEVPQNEIDPTMKTVGITTVYAKYDLDDLGIPQLWKFILGGSNYKVLKKERAGEPQICVVNIDMRAHTCTGSSIFDVSGEDQDTMTSVLRATLDNLHAATNRRLVVNDTLTNMTDVLSQVMSAPIRVRTAPAAAIQELGYTPTTGAALPFLQYLQQMADNKVGVTQAASGLDPDALQSTDKDAVHNTIQLMQGQVELICRNMAETMMPLFRGLLKLSMQHKDSYKTVQMSGTAVPIDKKMLNPDRIMQPKVGLGTNNVMQQRVALQFVLSTQMGAFDKLGPSNPLCNMSHISNTLEDICRTGNLNNVDRYFAAIDPGTGAKLAEEAAKAAEAAAKEAAGKPDPATALLQAEGIKKEAATEVARIRELGSQRAAAIDKQFEGLKLSLTDDFNRDKLAQERHLAFADLVGKYGLLPAFEAAQAKIDAEQEKERDLGA